MNDNSKDGFINEEENILEWVAPEHPFKQKTKEWKLSVIIIGAGFVIGSIMLENFVFALLSVATVLSIFIVMNNPPKNVPVSISKKGIDIDSNKYHYVRIESFWINEMEEPPRLLFKTDKTLSLLISIQIVGVDEEEVREKLLQHIDEEEMYEPFFQRLMEYLGL